MTAYIYIYKKILNVELKQEYRALMVLFQISLSISSHTVVVDQAKNLSVIVKVKLICFVSV